jgi:hypothetical protein
MAREFGAKSGPQVRVDPLVRQIKHLSLALALALSLPLSFFLSPFSPRSLPPVRSGILAVFIARTPPTDTSLSRFLCICSLRRCIFLLSPVGKDTAVLPVVDAEFSHSRFEVHARYFRVSLSPGDDLCPTSFEAGLNL